MIAVATLLVSVAATAQTVVRMSSKETDCTAWASANFAKGKVPPFSFVYGGRPSSEFIRKWKFSAEKLTPERVQETLTSYKWTDPATGFEVVCQVKTFDDFNAVEWVLYFRNSSSHNSQQISQVKVFDVAPQSSAKTGAWELFYNNGSNAGKHDFMAMTKDFSVGDNFEMMPYGGRSSSHAFPFFNVKTPTGGAIFAIGWTGSWKAEISRPSTDRFRVATGMKTLDTYLLPGEEIRTPSTAMLLWRGEDRMDGQNSFRRFLLAHHHPTVSGGEPAQFPVSTSFNYGDPAPCNEYTCMTTSYAVALVERYEQFHLVPDVFWLDAGWYEGANDWQHGYNWYNTTGNWVVDPVRFPQGMGAISDAVHAAGAKFMVWFEPERVNRSSYWAHEHPEYLMNATGEPANIVEGPTDHSHIVDLGNPEALEWMTESVKKLIRDNRIDYYRQDYNLDPEGFWWNNDKDGRRGISEIRYICGLYKFWDNLRAEFPDLLIDNCASGGRRIDLETTSRSAPMWRTDYNYGEPIGSQCHTYGLCQWLPVHGTGISKVDRFSFRSGFSWSLITNWSVTSPDSNLIEMQHCLAEFKSVQPYFLEDFYPLTGYGDMTQDNIWLAYQLHRESDQTGYVVAFRREGCPDEHCTVKMRGLEAGATYILEDQDNGNRIEGSAEVLSAGFPMTLGNARSSLLIKYMKK